MKKAFIIKLIAGKYMLKDVSTNKVFEAVGKGKLRYQVVDENSSFLKQKTKRTKKEKTIMQISPKVGDYVYYDDSSDIITITEILERKNELIRPDVSNIDQILLIFSAVSPDFSFNLLDKFLVIMEQENLIPIIIVSKIDLITDEVLNILKSDLKYYEMIGYKVYYVNSKQKIGFDVLENIFVNKVTVLAGQTGVGKSTLLNALLPDLELRTQEISKALGRGKHTTRHSELYEFNGGYIADTPGFSKIEFTIFEKEDVKKYFIDFVALSKNCKFMSSCNHIEEPSCEVKKLYKNNQILKSRYENYISFYEEVKNQKVKY